MFVSIDGDRVADSGAWNDGDAITILNTSFSFYLS